MSFEHEIAPVDQVSGGMDQAAPAPGKRTLSQRHHAGEGSTEGAHFSTGERLPGGLRARFESSLGSDLGEVRVHTDEHAQESAAELRARAYTVGNDIFFARGSYDPESRPGQALLAHEVAHTVQQQGAAPGPMAKLEVSQGGDAAETEADHAASAMIGGRSFQVTRGIAAGMISRDPHELPPMEIRDESLPDAVARDVQPWGNAYDQTVTWGSGQTTTYDAQGNAHQRDSAIMQNAGENGRHGREDLQGLSQELDAIRPLLRQWIVSNQTANSIAQNNSLDPSNPQQYAAEVREALGTRTLQNPQSATGREMQAQLRGASSTALQGAAARVNASIAKLQGVKNRLEAYRTRLEAAKRRREVTEAEGELTRINETISTITTVITTIATVVAAAAGAAAAASSAVSGALIEAPATLGSEVPGITGSGAGRVQAGASQVAGASNIIEGVLRYVVFAERIDGINNRIATLNSQIASLTQVSERLDATAMSNDLNQAKSEYQAASLEASNAQQNFFNAMRMAGRTYDRRGMSERESGNVAGPMEGPGQTISMEALMSFVAALQGRGSARTSFAAMIANSRYLNRADDIANSALEGRRAGMMGPDRVLARPDIDYSDPSQGFNPTLATQLEARSLRATIQVVTGNMAALRDQGPNQEQQEQQWMALVNSASGGLVH